MPSRRQERVARLVQQIVSDAITNHLNDPRIEGLVSVTRVKIAPDLRNADVYLSVLAKDETTQKRTFSAITHAKNHIQALVAEGLSSKFCPVLHIRWDESLKKTMETLKLIEKTSNEMQNDIETDLP